jgi:hypothetical protein
MSRAVMALPRASADHADVFPADVASAPESGEPFGAALRHFERLLAEAAVLLELAPARED